MQQRQRWRSIGDAAASIHCSFVPFIVERFGAYEAQALAFVHKFLGRISSDVFTRVNWAARTLLSYWLQRLSVCLWSHCAREVFVFES